MFRLFSNKCMFVSSISYNGTFLPGHYHAYLFFIFEFFAGKCTQLEEAYEDMSYLCTSAEDGAIASTP